MYTVKEIDNETWESFLLKQPYTPFVQSYHYGRFYELLNEKYFILGLFDSADTLVGGSLIVSTHAKRGRFLYLPYGPVLDYSNNKIVQTFFNQLSSFAKEKGYHFIRISPLLDDTKEGRETLREAGLRPAPMHVLAENSWILKLTDSENKLLAHMKKNHRNLIRRCEREGVRIESGTSQELMNILHDMLDVTEKRLKFTRFSRSYIEKEFNEFSKNDHAKIFVSYLPDGRPDAAAIIMFYGNMAVYRHSGSLNLDRKLPTSYLIQWEVIKEAKRRGLTWYNFWGVNPEDEPNHPFAGIGHFKRGFGGEQKDLVHAHDLPLSPIYWANWIIESMRRIRRGF